ncbi:MAG: hypothetical protein ABW221_15655 [Vicinamibacteria bacterium]
MTLTRWATLAVLVLPLPALGADLAPLSPADRNALLTAACSWADGARAEVARQRCAPPSDLVWSTARPGRFVKGDGEWLVSLAGPCIGGCPGVTFVARRQGDGWVQVAADPDGPIDERLVTDDCVTVRGLADGWDRVACRVAAGPHQGFMTELVELRTYAKGVPERQLLFKEHGGECTLGDPSARVEYDGDVLSRLSAGPPGSNVALTVQLTVKRARCTPGAEDPEKQATVRSTHVLRFVKRGNDVVQDEATAALVARHGWLPER